MPIHLPFNASLGAVGFPGDAACPVHLAASLCRKVVRKEYSVVCCDWFRADHSAPLCFICQSRKPPTNEMQFHSVGWLVG
jgi:hypothetical protein